MNILDMLKGKTIEVMTDAKVIVPLVVAKAEEISHSEDIEPATRENDWYPNARTWTTIQVTFTNGHRKTFNSITEIKILE